MKITFVEKILPDGSPCKKCGEVISRMEESGQMQRIDEILVADERDPASPGMQLARELNVDRAPFFVVDHDDGRQDIYTVYFKFVKEVIEEDTDEADDLQELLNDNPDLDRL
ncbi:hypothetical protein FT643_09635 [Ketobacter sp. MCCC 1A13808]|uniref:hypothetical protein n=1 Tax=Ketobacter sp. MCCC 1A13808 TaxID=2602738 RepID=UPI000F13F7E8|nr:hypothetical protein [Ketobacter sp. MCCC 1A13808]MVF12403.1 hypothetical protein [Ketobacter sp. MCCC 1A13808]RLP55782.1 MAG: hypothetical protein D6160_05155 [Ketobacter sp.]